MRSITDTNITQNNVPKQTNLPKQIYRVLYNLPIYFTQCEIRPRCVTHARTHTHTHYYHNCQTKHIYSPRGPELRRYSLCPRCWSLSPVQRLQLAASQFIFFFYKKTKLILITAHAMEAFCSLLTSEGNEHCNRIILCKPISQRVLLLYHPTTLPYATHFITGDHSKTRKCSQMYFVTLLCHHIAHYFTISLTVTAHTTFIIILSILYSLQVTSRTSFRTPFYDV